MLYCLHLADCAVGGHAPAWPHPGEDGLPVLRRHEADGGGGVAAQLRPRHQAEAGHQAAEDARPWHGRVGGQGILS